MGTIADKLEYLNDTKEAIAQAIVAKGQPISASDTFRDYADKIEAISGGGTKTILPAGTVLYFSDVPAEISPTGQAIYVTDDQIEDIFSKIDTKNIFNFSFMFEGYSSYGCSLITTAPQLDTSNAITFQEMFRYCTALENVPIYDTSDVESMSAMFDGCTNLTDESLNNILIMCINATNINPGDKYLAVVVPQYGTEERIESLPAYQDFINAGWGTYIPD